MRHWVSTRTVPAQYTFEERLGYLLQSGGPGRAALYSCMDDEYEFLSLEANCEGKRVEGINGWVYETKPSSGPPTVGIHRCFADARDRFVSTDAGCERRRHDKLLGYIPTEPPS